VSVCAFVRLSIFDEWTRTNDLFGWFSSGLIFVTDTRPLDLLAAVQWAAVVEETSSKKNLHDAIYFWAKKITKKISSSMPYISKQKKSPRSNPRKKFQANKNLINAAIYFCEFLELICIRNVSKQRQTIFLPNAWSDQ
jgi:hypothetical protein